MAAPVNTDPSDVFTETSTSTSKEDIVDKLCSVVDRSKEGERDVLLQPPSSSPFSSVSLTNTTHGVMNGCSSSDGSDDYVSSLSQSSWLLRFFQSDFFDAWVAVAYLFRYHDSGVHDYLCNALYRLPTPDVEFYLPQLINMYVHRSNSHAIERFILECCSRLLHFALLAVWFLDSHLQDGITDVQRARCLRLRNQILIANLKVITPSSPSTTLASTQEPANSPHFPRRTSPPRPGAIWRDSPTAKSRIHECPTKTDVDSTSPPVTPKSSHIYDKQITVVTPLPPSLLKDINVAERVECSRSHRPRSMPPLTQVAIDSMAALSHLNESSKPSSPSPTASNIDHTCDSGGEMCLACRRQGFPRQYSDCEKEYCTKDNIVGDGCVKMKSANQRRQGMIVAWPEGNAINGIVTNHVQSNSHGYSAMEMIPGIDLTTGNAFGSTEGMAGSMIDFKNDHGSDCFHGFVKSSSTSTLHDLGLSALDRSSKNLSNCNPPQQDTDNNTENGNSQYHMVPLHRILAAQCNFIQSVVGIGYRLLRFETKELRYSQLYAELSLINLNLPARVYLPLWTDEECHHHVVRVVAEDAVVLNSKDRVPFLLLLEVVGCENRDTSCVPERAKESLRTNRRTLMRNENLAKSHMSANRNDSRVTHDDGQEKAFSDHSDDLNSNRKLLTKPIDSISSAMSSSAIAKIVTRRKDTREQGRKKKEMKRLPMFSDSDEDDDTMYVAAIDIRQRLAVESERPKSGFVHSTDDPSAVALKEPWQDKVARTRKASPYGHLPTWSLYSVIVKCGDDLRQEQLASQLIFQFQRIWTSESVPLWLRPYRVLVTSNSSGIIETVTDAISLHSIKKQTCGSLFDYFVREFGDVESPSFKAAVRCFVESLAAYSLICYFLQVKDRHNGNILIEAKGHILHIDFGFLLSNSPGKNLGFESAPFKLTPEFIEVMGGVQSADFEYFRSLLLRGFIAARKHMDKVVVIVELMQQGSHLPCFSVDAVCSLKERFHITATEEQLSLFVDGMISTSMTSITTRLYDRFQYLSAGVM